MANTLESVLTSYLRRLATRRVNRSVTADDVNNYLVQKGYDFLSQNERLSVTRSVLNEQNFTPTGTAPSARPEARGRQITVWTY
jgi:hypothetical protein